MIGIPLVVYLVMAYSKGGIIKNIINPERGKLAFVGDAHSRTSLNKCIHKLMPHCFIGVAQGCVVEVTAHQHRKGRAADMGGDLLGLLRSLNESIPQPERYILKSLQLFRIIVLALIGDELIVAAVKAYRLQMVVEHPYPLFID